MYGAGGGLRQNNRPYRAGGMGSGSTTDHGEKEVGGKGTDSDNGGQEGGDRYHAGQAAGVVVAQ